MQKVNLYYILMFVPVAILQLVIVPFIAVNGIAPNLLAILVIFYAVRVGQIKGMLFGFASGFVFDMISGGVLGSSMFALTVVGFIAGYLYVEHESEMGRNYTLMILIIIFCSILDSFLFSVLGVIDLNFSLTHLIIYQGMLPGIYTTLVSIPVLLVFYKRASI